MYITINKLMRIKAVDKCTIGVKVEVYLSNYYLLEGGKIFKC